MMRGGARAGTSTVVAAVLITPAQSSNPAAPSAGWQCGFIVSKAVGNAVVRHRTTRRLRHIVRELIEAGQVSLPEGRHTQIVLRALSEAPSADHRNLRQDTASALRRALKKAAGRQNPGTDYRSRQVAARQKSLSSGAEQSR